MARRAALPVLSVVLLAAVVRADPPAVPPPAPLARWGFETLVPAPGVAGATRDDAAGRDDAVLGHAWLVPGVAGKALLLDGISAHLVRPAGLAPRLPRAFTVSAWVALGAYPFNDAPVFQRQDERRGFFLGLGDRGQAVLRAASGGRWLVVRSEARVPLRRWAHVAAVVDGASAALYLDGRPAGRAELPAGLDAAEDAAVWIGRNAFALEQTAPVGSGRQRPCPILLDGVLDEIELRPGAATAGEIAARAARERPSAPPPLEARSLPRLPDGPRRFGAVSTRLRYYRGWDEAWRVGDSPDVVVRFDAVPSWLAFWRGTSYIPHWVTENGIWYDNEFTETFPPELVGSAEPMSDKQCRFSHVRVLESSDARAVVHWRYAPVGVGYLPAWTDPQTGWFDWTDEVHTIYPDGVGVRSIVVHTSRPEKDREWHEGIVVMGPGTTPDDALEPTGLTLANSRGESVDVSWRDGVPPHVPPQPERAGIQLIHTRSRFKPFAIARSQDDPSYDVYSGEIRRDVSIYPWWNHWPTAFEPSNGRYALAADRASHSSLTHLRWRPLSTGPETIAKVHLEGLTDGGVAELAALARSWEAPARLRVESPGFAGGEYDPRERAWLLARAGAAAGAPLALTLEASEGSPLHGIALVVRGWGDGSATLRDDSGEVPGARFGRRDTLEGADLVVFAPLRATAPRRLVLAPR